MSAPWQRDRLMHLTLILYFLRDDWAESQDLINCLKDDIIQRLERRERRLNILVFGPPGVGKSAFITSMATALSGHFHEYAVSGHHGGDPRPITFFMKRYIDCGLDDDYKRDFRDAHLPTLVDMAGLPNEEVNELLRTLYYGRLMEDLSITEASRILTTEGIEALRRRCPLTDPKLMIDCIIFVCSACEMALPEELIRCVVDICRPRGTDGRKRATPLFGMMTKIDKVDVLSDSYKDQEKAFQAALGIRGSSHRFFRCINYCDDTTPSRCEVNYPALDIPLLKFCKQLVDPFVKVEYDEEIEDYTYLNRPTHRMWVFIGNTIRAPIIAVRSIWGFLSGRRYRRLPHRD